jgi:hypothetical protein
LCSFRFGWSPSELKRFTKSRLACDITVRHLLASIASVKIESPRCRGLNACSWSSSPPFRDATAHHFDVEPPVRFVISRCFAERPPGVGYRLPQRSPSTWAQVSFWMGGDSVCLAADAIVNAVNSHLLPGGGICGAVHSDPQLTAACARLPRCPTDHTVASTCPPGT